MLCSAVRIPRGAFTLVKEIGRHLLRRPVVGVAALASVPDGRLVFVRRRDTGEWALPGGTLEWGETLRQALRRELHEEAGVQVLRASGLAGVYSDPRRDERFHAVTVVVRAEVSFPSSRPLNPVEIAEVGLFLPAEVPHPLAHGMSDMLAAGRSGAPTWE